MSKYLLRYILLERVGHFASVVELCQPLDICTCGEA